MCGHIGMMGKQLLAKEEDAIEDGLFISALRGSDSVGVGVVPYNAEQPPFVQKRLGMAPYHLTLPLAGAKVIIGHVRSATIGNRGDRELAHPFMFDNIIGAHNGTLRGNWRQVLQDQTNEVFGSDSQALFYNFAYWGVKETIESIYGAWCLVWWDEDEYTLNMLRNDERPMWTAQGKDGNLYWASEHWMINGMLRAGEKDRDKLVRTKMEDKDEERFFHKLPKNIWRRWSFNEAGEVIQLDDIPLVGAKEPEYVPPKKAEGKPGDSFVYARYENGGWVEGFDAENSLKLDKEYFEGAPNTRGTFYRVVAGVPYVSRTGSAEIKFSEFLDFRTSGCCSTCGTNIGHPAQIGYIPKDLSWFLCKDCTRDWTAAAGVGTLKEMLELIDDEVAVSGPPEGMDDDGNPMVTMGTPPNDNEAENIAALLDAEANNRDKVWLDGLNEDSDWVVTSAGGHILLGTGCTTRQECMAYVAKMKGSNFRAMRRSTANQINDRDLADEAALQADAEAAYAASVDPDRQSRRRIRREKARIAAGPVIDAPLHPTEDADTPLPFDLDGDGDDEIPADLAEMLPPALLAKIEAHAAPKRDMSKWNWFDGPRG